MHFPRRNLWDTVHVVLLSVINRCVLTDIHFFPHLYSVVYFKPLEVLCVNLTAGNKIGYRADTSIILTTYLFLSTITHIIEEMR